MGIEIECANARAEARKLIDICEQCGSIKSTVLREKDLVPEYMYGSTGTSTMELMQAWSRGLGSIESDLVDLSNTIINIANDMEEAERRRAEKIAAQQVRVIAAGLPASHSTPGMQQVSNAVASNWTNAVQSSSKKSEDKDKNVIEEALGGLSNLGANIFNKLGIGRK